MSELTPKEKFDKAQEAIIGRQMLEGLLYGLGTIKGYAKERGLDEKRIVQILNNEAKKLIQRKDYENQKSNMKNYIKYR